MNLTISLRVNWRYVSILACFLSLELWFNGDISQLGNPGQQTFRNSHQYRQTRIVPCATQLSLAFISLLSSDTRENRSLKLDPVLDQSSQKHCLEACRRHEGILVSHHQYIALSDKTWVGFFSHPVGGFLTASPESRLEPEILD
jgi:hypothetical protein